MDTREYFLREQKKALAQAKDLNDRAETEEDEKLIEAFLAKAAEFAAEIDALDKKEERAKAIESFTGPYVEENEQVTQPSSVGDAFVKSAGYQAAKSAGFSGSWQTGIVEIPDYFDGEKTLMDSTASAGALVPQVIPGIRTLPNQVLRVASLAANIQTDAPSLRLLKEITATNAADAVAESGTKQESTLVLDDVNVTLQKIATVLTITDELLADVPGMRDYINTRGTYFVRQKEDSELLNGTGSSPHISGYLDDFWGIPTGSALSLDADAALDAILMAVTKIRVDGEAEPDGIVMNPYDYHTLRTQKDANRQYYAGGPFTGAYGNGAIPGGTGGPDIWQYNTVLTPAIAQGTVLVGAFQAHSAIYRKGGLQVDATNSHASTFVTNQTTLRFEERLALMVYRPQAFYVITSLSGLIS